MPGIGYLSFCTPSSGFLIPFSIILSRLPIAVTDHLSSTTSHESTDAVNSSGSDLLKRLVSCVLTVASGGFSAFPFLPLLISPRSSGFYPPRCYQASSALSPQYYS